MSTPPPVSCCLIVKNEIRQIESCLSSIRPHVKELVVVDTGSTDGTWEICARFADIHERFDGCNDKDGRILDFSVARQRSFDLATQPWVMWIDGDDEVVGAERIGAILAEAESKLKGPILVMLPYDYSHDAEGNVTCLHYRERICRPKDNFKWTNPVHEVLTPVGSMSVMRTDDIRIIHRRQESGKVMEPNRNLRILKAYYDRVGDSDTRQLYYLGLEYANAGDIRTSIEFHKKYVARSGWDDEKCLSCLEIARHHQAFGEYDQAIEWGLRATTVKENWGEPYFSLGKSYYFLAQRGGPDAKRNWERSISFFKRGLSLPPSETILFVNPMERNHEVHKFLNLALNSVGDVSGALESAKSGLSAVPKDEGLQLNASLYEEHIAKRTIEEKIAVLVGLGKMSGDTAVFMSDAIHGRAQVKVVPGKDGPKLAESPIPAAAGPVSPSESPSFKPLTSVFEKTKNPMDIALFVGFGVEPWTPATFAKTGLGGSETMAWEMARRLSAIGNRVRLYGDCKGMEGTFDGVEFLHYESFKDVSCDVLISSRRPHVVDDSLGCRARVKACWIHDVHCGDAMTHARALRFDRILCLSEWHKDVVLGRYPFVHPSQAVVTRNGINLSRFDKKVDRNPHRMVYSSSPDRGLQTAITSMPLIRKAVPDAELHVFYGFKTWEASAQGDDNQLAIIRLLRTLLEQHKNDGVHFHDRVDQETLAVEFLKSGVWGYPTWFSETSCITAMEAQAAGLRIVTSPIAALNETVGPRGKMVSGDWLSSEYRTAFSDAVIEAMTKTGDEDRSALMEHASRSFGLDSLAVQWDGMLHGFLEDVERDIVVPYKVVA